MDAERLLLDLDPHQRAAVATPSTLVAVIAAAGAGKTRVLTRRIAHRIALGSAEPQHTLALTFTREAAGELRRRLRRAGMRESVEAGTFHSIALATLRTRWADTNRPTPTIINDPQRLLADVAGSVSLDALVAERTWLAARGGYAASYVELIRASGRRPGAQPFQVAAGLERYEELKRRRGVIDLDDLLTMLTAELEGDAAFAEAVQWRFRHLLVDEAQDLNPSQYRLMRAILGDRTDLFLVGDPAQAIYGFNGSDPTLLRDVDQHLPGVEIVRLPSNHRCTPAIVAAGNHALRAGNQPDDAVSAREPLGPVEFVVTANEDDEAARVAELVLRCPPRVVHDGDVAVLARTHQQLTGIRKAMSAAGIPMQQNALATGSPLAVSVQSAARLGSSAQLRAWAHDTLDQPPPQGGARSPSDEADHRVAAAVLEFLRESPLGDGAALRGWVTTTRPFARPDDANGVELVTFHAAKGREWSTVVVTGVETGLVPHRSATTLEGRAEEARLLHVAFTRAADRLVVVRSQRRRGYQRHESPFVVGLVAAQADAAPTAVPIPEAVAAIARGHSPAHDRIASLVAWRAAVAKATSVLPGHICSDGDLHAIAEAPPASAADLAEVVGFGPVTAARHFPAIHAALTAVSTSR